MGAQPSQLQSHVATIIVATAPVNIVRKGGKQETIYVLNSTNNGLFSGDTITLPDRSSATIRLASKSVLCMKPGTSLRVEESGDSGTDIQLFKGILHFLNRWVPDSLKVKSLGATTAVRGTEFVIATDPETQSSKVFLFDGELEISNEQGRTNLVSRQSATAQLGKAPVVLGPIEAYHESIQWFLYYPSVVNMDEVGLSTEEALALKGSVDAYQEGNIPLALSLYPQGRIPLSDSERVYYAAIVLAAGDVPRSRDLLSTVRGAAPPDSPISRVAAALSRLIQVIVEPPRTSLTLSNSKTASLSSELMVDSYALQANGRLGEALLQARRATEVAPAFGFASERVAELEFAHGRTGQAEASLGKALALSSNNVQAIVLKGFILAARNQAREAREWFGSALALDGRYGRAWLGRGLCSIRLGKVEEGLEDLLIAASVNPRSSQLRSYLGKAFSESRDNAKALHELELARWFDTGDPTPLLYRALVLEQENRINEAVQDLALSKTKNGNRQVFRSRELLDQDRAVAGANQARIYQDVGLSEAALSSAMGALSDDYANPSAHLFLANVYDGLRDPRLINLRYESAWLNEYLLANLLAPAGAGILSPYVSQEEYSRLFDRNRLGFTSTTEFYSRGDWVQNASQWGIYNGSSYALEESYRSERGDRPNRDFESRSITLHLKQDVGLRDSVYFQVEAGDTSGGDVRPVYNPQTPITATGGYSGYYPSVRVTEQQAPGYLAGFHRAWSPESHTLLFVGGGHQEQRVVDPLLSQQFLFLETGPNDMLPWVRMEQGATSRNYRSSFQLFTSEFQQIGAYHSWNWILGSRIQTGTFNVSNDDYIPYNPNATHAMAEAKQTNQIVSANMQRFSLYHCVTKQLMESLELAAGVSFDNLVYPRNYRFPPILSGEERRSLLSPKAGISWRFLGGGAIRAAFTRSLGGTSLDQSQRIEPSQIVGIQQTWRSLIPESVEAANSAPIHEAITLGIDRWLGSATYGSLSVNSLEAYVDRTRGAYLSTYYGSFMYPGASQERLRFREVSMDGVLTRLVGNDISVGARGRVSFAKLESLFPEVSQTIPDRHISLDGVLRQVELFWILNHPAGFFFHGQGIWTSQNNGGALGALPDEDFWQFNLFAGWRGLQRRIELRVGMLNPFDQDYRLNPLNVTPEFPRQRTFVASVKLSF